MQSKLPDVGVTIFTVMTRLANEQHAINLSQGFPDFKVDPGLIHLVGKAMAEGNNQYAPMQGALPLREMISEKVRDLHIIFDGLRHESISRYPELAERSFIVSSFGKKYHTTGWKIGYCCAPSPLSAEFRKIHQYLTFASNTPIQYAYAKFMDRKDQYLALPKFYEAKRDLFLSLVKNSRFRAIPSKGTYFQMLDYSGITGEADTAFARRMTIEHRVAAIPPSVFYHDGTDNKVLRFCFAKKDETLEKAAEQLCKI